MWWSGHKILEPYELESRFSTEDCIFNTGITFTEEMSEDTKVKVEKIKTFLDMIPKREADFVELYYFQHMKQTDIANLFCVTQPTVCYRLQRASARIKFLVELPDITLEQIQNDLEDVLVDPLDVQIMIQMYQTTCQSEVAKNLNVSQGLVRHRFIRSIKRLGCDGYDELVGVYNKISENLNILREVQRPSLSESSFIVLH
jgi:DNA-directed RNA polymerase specialized sigma subunit